MRRRSEPPTPKYRNSLSATLWQQSLHRGSLVQLHAPIEQRYTVAYASAMSGATKPVTLPVEPRVPLREMPRITREALQEYARKNGGALPRTFTTTSGSN